MDYQLRNSVGEGLFECIIYSDFSFGHHLHRFLEIVYVLEGELQAIIDGKEHMMQPGEMALIIPHTIHEYHAPSHNRIAVFVISDDLIPSVSKKLNNAEADDYVFKPEKPVRDFFDYSLLQQDNPDSLLIKAAVYAIVQSFLQTHKLRKKEYANSDLLQKILTYVAENFREVLTLETLSKELGYNCHYISCVFNKALRINFRQFVNLYRVDHACMLLRETNMDITSVSMECGFQSIRSFNRAFLQATHEQPLKYRQRFQD